MANPSFNDHSDSVQEIWLPVHGWEGLYEVSSLGRVRSLDRIVVSQQQGVVVTRRFRGRIMKLFPGTDGYDHVKIQSCGKNKNLKVHIAVCEAFHGPRPNGHLATHRDGNRTNNCARNLKWGTNSDNSYDAIRHGTRRVGEDHPTRKLNTAQVHRIRATSTRAELMALADEFGVSLNHTYAVRRGYRQKYI